MKIPVFSISSAPSAYTTDVSFVASGGSCVLQYTSEHSGSLVRGAVRFGNVRAYRYLAESHCTSWHVEDCYEQVARVDHSTWLNELTKAYSGSKPLWFEVKHFIVYVGDHGAYEVACDSAMLIDPD